jgi:Winged helix DNA-binding domain
MVTKLSKIQVNSWRLSKHYLVERAKQKDLARVVSDVCGIQSQVLSAAELAINARVEGVTRQDIREALWTDHSIVKTWCMRGTLHLLASDDLPLFVAALKTKLTASKDWLEKNHRISPNDVDTVTAEVGQALEKNTLTREELARTVQSRTDLGEEIKKALMSGWGILLRPAAYKGLLAFGPNVGPRVTFLKPVTGTTRGAPTTVEAFRVLFRRFLSRYGPATFEDFDHWWGNIPDEESIAIEADRDDLELVEVNGFRGMMIRSDVEEARKMDPVQVVRLLPSFDSYVMFYSPREWIVPSAKRSRIFRQLAGWNYPSVVVDGTAAGIWTVKKRRKKIHVEIEAFRKLGPGDKAGIADEVERIGEFLESPTEVRYVSQI